MFRLRFRWRNLFQFSGLALFFILAWQTRYPLRLKGWSNAFFRADPFLAVTAAIATKTIAISFWPALLLLALTLVFGRFFCRNICPLGTCIDLASFLSARKRWRKSPRLRFLFAVQIYALVIFLVLAGFGLAGIIQQFDPLVISLGMLLSLPGLALVLAIILVSAVFPRFWCFNLCPLGAILELAARAGKKLKKRPAAFDLSRRQFLSALFLGLLAGSGLKFRKKGETAGRILRPPAAGKETEFTSRCVRCGDVLKSVPATA